jgi:autotransporter family porin
MPANNGKNVVWGTGDDSFKLWPQERAFVTGQYVGTTDEILQWAAYKWGFDPNLARADAVQETHWKQTSIGDQCSPNVTGEGSYGILQAKNKNCSGTTIQGGYPDTFNDTALDADFWGAHLRACYDGAFQGWLYDGKTVAADITAHSTYVDPTPITGNKGQDYVLWGCIGFWFSGGWWDSGASSYISSVQGYYTSKPWLQAGF